MYIILGSSLFWYHLVICTINSFITIRKSVQKSRIEYLISLIFIFPKNLSRIHISFVLIKMTESSQKAFSKRDSNSNVTTLFARNYTHFTNDISCFHITTTPLLLSEISLKSVIIVLENCQRFCIKCQEGKIFPDMKKNYPNRHNVPRITMYVRLYANDCLQCRVNYLQIKKS